MSVAFTLTSGATTITLNPKWDLKLRTKMNRSDHRMQDASLFSYKFGSYKVMHFTVEGLSPSDAGTINGWWEAGTSLTFSIDRDGSVETSTVKIVGNRTPFPKFLTPRVDYYEGKLEMEATT